MEEDPAAAPSDDTKTIFVDEEGNKIVDTGSPDWTKWRSSRIENDENGNVNMVCVPIPQSEIDADTIAECKQNLADTDYVIAKIAESMVSGISLSEDDATRYADVISQRQQWRATINELEVTQSGSGQEDPAGA